MTVLTRRLWLAGATVGVLVGMLREAAADSIITETLGPALGYAMLLGPNAGGLTHGTFNGDVAVAGSVGTSGGTFKGDVIVDGSMTMSGGTISGNLYVGTGSFTESGNRVAGNVYLNGGPRVGNAWNAAVAASSAFAALPANLTIGSNGDSTIIRSGTINATGAGTYVVDVDGTLNGSSITITGSPTDDVILNFGYSTNGLKVTLGGGLTPSHVVYNLTGSSAWNGGGAIDGIVLAPAAVVIAPSIDGEYIGGRSPLVSGVTAETQPVPLPAAVWGGLGLIGVGVLLGRRVGAE